MSAEPDLLPLPEPVAVKYPDSGLRDDEHALRLWAAHGYDTGGEPLFSAEQLCEATAPLQAEIEALRAEVGETKEVAVRAMRQRDAQYNRAERLAEALRNIAAMRWSSGEDLMDAAGAARAALREQEAGRG